MQKYRSGEVGSKFDCLVKCFVALLLLLQFWPTASAAKTTAFALAILNPSLWFWQDPEDCGMVTVAHFMVLMVVSPTSIAKSTNIPSSESMALEIRRSPWTESSGAKYLPNRRGGPLRCPVARPQ